MTTAKELADQLLKANTATDLAWMLGRIESQCVNYPKDAPADTLIERILAIVAEGKP